MQAGAKLRRRRPCNGTRWLVTMIALGAVATSTARMTVSGLVLDINGNPVPQARVILARLPEVTATAPASARDIATAPVSVYTTVFSDQRGRFAFREPLEEAAQRFATLEAKALGYRMVFPTQGPAPLLQADGVSDISNLVLVLQPQHNMADTAPASAWLRSIPDTDPQKALVVRECVACHQIAHSDMRRFVSAMDDNPVSRSREARKFGWKQLLTYMYGTSHEYFGGAIGFQYSYQLDGREAQYLEPVAEFLATHLPERLDYVEYDYGAPLAVTADTQIREYPVSRPGEKFNTVGIREAILAGSPLQLWVADVAADRIYRIDPDTGRQRALSIPYPGATGPHSIYRGHDGRIWVTYLFQQLHGTIDLNTDRITIVQRKTTNNDYYISHDFATDWQGLVTTDSRGRLWFGDVASNSLGAVGPAGEAAILYPSPEKLLVQEHSGSDARAGVHLDDLYMYGTVITSDRKHIWYTQLNGRFGEFNTETLQYETVVNVPPAAGPRRLAITEKDILYVPLFGAGQLVEYDARAHRQVAVYDLPDRGSAPYAVAWDPGRHVLWVATSNADAIYRFDPRDHAFAVIPLPRQREYLRNLQVESSTGLLATSTALLPARAVGPRMALIIDPGDDYSRQHRKANPDRAPVHSGVVQPTTRHTTVAQLEELMRANQCVSCHAVSEARIGPPLQAIAARYAQRPRAVSIETLAAKILYGGAGNWGVFPMPARERLFSAGEARALAAAIVDLEPGIRRGTDP